MEHGEYYGESLGLSLHGRIISNKTTYYIYKRVEYAEHPANAEDIKQQMC